MRKLVHLATLGITLAAAIGFSTAQARDFRHPLPAPVVEQHWPHHFHSRHDHGITKREAYRSQMGYVVANFERIDRNHDGRVTRAEIDAFRHFRHRHG